MAAIPQLPVGGSDQIVVFPSIASARAPTTTDEFLAAARTVNSLAWQMTPLTQPKGQIEVLQYIATVNPKISWLENSCIGRLFNSVKAKLQLLQEINFLKKNINVSVLSKTSEGRTALWKAGMPPYTPEQATKFHDSIKNGLDEDAISLLQKYPTLANAELNGISALQVAISGKQAKVVEALLKNGANATEQPNLMQQALAERQYEIVLLLSAAGAKIGSGDTISEENGLDIVRHLRSGEILQSLKLDLNTPSLRKSIVDQGKRYGNKATMEFLSTSGVKLSVEDIRNMGFQAESTGKVNRERLEVAFRMMDVSTRIASVKMLNTRQHEVRRTGEVFRGKSQAFRDACNDLLKEDFLALSQNLGKSTVDDYEQLGRFLMEQLNENEFTELLHKAKTDAFKSGPLAAVRFIGINLTMSTVNYSDIRAMMNNHHLRNDQKGIKYVSMLIEYARVNPQEQRELISEAPDHFFENNPPLERLKLLCGLADDIKAMRREFTDMPSFVIWLREELSKHPPNTQKAILRFIDDPDISQDTNFQALKKEIETKR